MFGSTPARSGVFGRRPSRQTPDRSQQGTVSSRPAPIGGWNARDALANMPPTDAVSLINWFPTPSICMVRQGYTNWSTGYSANVETVAAYNGATSKLWGCSGGGIYDATAGGAIGAAAVSGLAVNRWQYINFTTTAGTRYLCMVNGTDSPRFYDGAAWIAITAVSVPAITGLPGGGPADIIGITSHKSRIWLIRKNSLELYYLPVGLVGGASSLFDLRPIFKRGGKLVAAETWSADTGNGVDDRLVLITDQGEVAVYAGTDPTAAATWALVGLFWVGSAIGNRPMLKYGGDILIICQYGLLAISKLLQSVVIDTSQTLSGKIQSATSAALTLYGTNFGWQVMQFPKEDMLILNVPVTTTTAEQYVMNGETGAWCRFQGWNAFSWELWGDNLYFGGATAICRAWDQYDDAGVNIQTDLKCAFDYFGSPGVLKQWTQCRPIIASDGTPGITYGLNVDFEDTDVAGSPSFVPSSTGTWDAALWDSGIWGGGLSIYKGWQFLSGIGYCGAFRMKTSSRGIMVQLSAIDYLYAQGGVM